MGYYRTSVSLDFRGNILFIKTMKHLFENKSFQITRRSFLSKCTAAAAATGLPLWVVEKHALMAAEGAASTPPLPSPNDRPGIALIGCGGQGTGDATNASGFGDILAVCDVNELHLNAAAQKFTKDGKVPDKYS